MLRIEWSKISIAKLSAWWESADAAHQEMIMDAIDLIEWLITKDPAAAGESRDEGIRIIVAPPLSASYRFNERLNRAYIFSVHYFQRKA
jgi:hypothetical protein